MKRRISWAVGAALLAGALGAPLVALGGTAGEASATSCSTTTGNASCSISTSVTVTGGTLTLYSSPNLYWSFVLNGYDQWASASASALSGCTGSSTGTTCTTGASTPHLEVIDATGSGSGWALSEYLSSNDLPTGTVVHFDGTGSSTVGDSQDNPIATDPFSSTTPGTVCDYGSTCATATPATVCSHSSLGFTTCPTYPVNVAAGTSATAQVDLYSATSNSGMGAICFGSGAATAAGCTGTTADDYYNVGIPANTASSTYGTTLINLTVSSGP
ncbi:MAG TPA: hypothetical protein VMD59_09730 [Acidimicrobiales bacterium]|nr:hypothetical protein [Acidimicrobiales bacterium]